MSIISYTDLSTIRERHKNETLVFCSGCFDLTHAGHVLFFEDCKKHGDVLVVMVSCDTNIQNYKGQGRPILNEAMRLKMIDSLKSVDYCFLDKPYSQEIISKGLDEQVLRSLKPDKYIFNDDASNIEGRKKILETLGMQAVIQPRWMPPELGSISTTDIINRIKYIDKTPSGFSAIKRIPRIVITGAPGAGKSTVVDMFRKEYDHILQCVPEAASMLIINLGITPETKGADIVLEPHFQQTLYHMQEALERTAEHIAHKIGKTALILDKGRVDIAAHLQGGTDEYKRLFQRSHKDDYGEYDLVLCLGLPEKNVYDMIRRNNAARRETYEQARQIEKKLHSAWQNHSNIAFISHTSGWEEKMHAVRSAIDTFLNLSS